MDSNWMNKPHTRVRYEMAEDAQLKLKDELASKKLL